jgi:hexosaminidase
MRTIQNSSCKDGTLLTVGFSLRTWKASISSKSRRDGTLSIGFLSLCLCFLLGCSSKQTVTPPPVALTWEMGRNGIEPGQYDYTFYITNNGKTALEGNWVIYFDQVLYPVNQEDAPLTVERIQSTYCKMYPTGHYQAIAPGETFAFTGRSKGGLIKESAAPQGAYIVFLDENGKEQQPQNIPVEIVPFTHEYQWTRPAASELPYPDGNYMYEQNALFMQAVELSETDIFPSVKSVGKKEGSSSFSKNVQLKYEPEFENEAALLKEKLVSLFGCTISETGETVIELKKLALKTDLPDEAYEIDIQDNHFELRGGNAHAVFDACQTLLHLIGNLGNLPASIANIKISDYPDTNHRGIMLDVSRNFTKKENILKLIDLLSFYKLNVFHFHLTDDEAWRLEIPGLPELTETGARRGHTLDESTCLYPAFAWGWDASDNTTLANGYYSRNDFIEILQYANQRHIKVIPEVDIPGHSRAAIKSMNVRYNKYLATDKPKAEEYLLTDFADTSRYLSAQNFTDNVINVAMPSVYRFVEKVIDEIDKMYADAGLKMTVFHIGGDEVPRGAWEGSGISRDFMKAQGMTEIRELKDYFLEQVLPMLAKRNIQPAGWEEVAMLRDHTANPKFKDSQVLSYCWNTLPDWKGDEVPYLLANAGYPVILCNVTNFYMDMSYNKHPQEPGLQWGGFVNEYNSFDMLPYDIYKSVRRNLKGEWQDMNTVAKGKVALNTNARTQIKGVQGQLWAETIRNFEQIEYYLFPKMYGLVERAWNIQPAWSLTSDNQAYEEAKRIYNAKIALKELPRLSKSGVNFRIAQPGIKIIDGKLFANASIPGAGIRYTTDGSEPTEQSAVWTEPVPCDAKQIKAKAFYLGKASVTTIWNY